MAQPLTSNGSSRSSGEPPRGVMLAAEQVLGDLVDARLATPVAATVPLVTYKTIGGRR
jgi:hypothetical protein